VVSILLAFSIEAWWSESQRKNAQIEELSRLRAELVENRQRIEARYQDQTRYSRVIATTEKISNDINQALADGENTIEISVPDMGNLLEMGTMELGTPILDSLVKPGRIELIEGQQVLEALNLWVRMYKGVLKTQRDTREFILDDLYPALSDRADLQDLLFEGVPFQNTSQFEPSDRIQVRIDESLGNVVARRHFWTELNRVQWYRVIPAVDTAIEEITALIDQ